MTTRLINLTILDGLERQIGRARTWDLLQRYFVHADDIAGRVRDLAAAADRPALAAIGHQLVGNSGSLGLDEIAALGCWFQAHADAAAPAQLVCKAEALVEAIRHTAAALVEGIPGFTLK